MSPRSPDTDPKMEELQFELLRRASPTRRLELAFQLSAMVRNGVRSAIDRAYPYETREQRDERFLTQLYGQDVAKAFIAYRRRVHGPVRERPTP